MNQSASYTVNKKGQGGPENQFLLTDSSAKNGAVITPKAYKTSSEFQNSSGSERQPFLDKSSSEPVKLTPAWEENNLPNDELHFKGVTMEQAEMELRPPTDRFNLVFLTLVLHGVGVLMPWNMFITAKSYFVDYKLSFEYTGVESEYATYFLTYLGFAAQVPNVIFNWLNIFIRMGGNLTTRIVWSIFIEVVIFVFTVVLAMTDSSQWPGIFFWVTMATVVFLNMANGIYQNTVFGMGAKLPFKYTGAIILGSNISGTFSSIIALISEIIAPNARTAAIYYFITALFVLLACFDTYFALPLNRFYRYHELLNHKELQMKKRGNDGNTPSIPYCTILRQASVQLLNVFFIFFVTLSIFPAIHSDVKISDREGFVIPEKYYATVTCFLTFNVSAMLGSLLSSWVQWPKPKFLIIPVLLRALFIPFFVFCNYQPLNIERVFPVLIKNDYVYWSGAMLMGSTSGYLSALAMMYVPRTVEPSNAATAGMFGGAALITGIFSGILFSMVYPWFVVNVSWDLNSGAL